MWEEGEVVAVGTWLYDGSVKAEVTIQKMPILFGSGDYQDPPEIREDREVESYYIWFAPAGEPGEFRAGGGAELTLEKAKRRAEELVGQEISWRETV